MSDDFIEGPGGTGRPASPETASGGQRDPRQAGHPDRVAHAGATPDASADAGAPAGLFDQQEVAAFSDRWEDIQVRFVDQPQESVAAADQLVDDVVNAMTTRLGDQRRQLESLWQHDEEVSTEQLRQSLQRYHALFDRLLSTPSAPAS